jgi:hypothetical protein
MKALAVLALAQAVIEAPAADKLASSRAVVAH